ncbi:MAG: hypothetical protein Q9159_002593 [Coniocarpon cinnabarinum]
MISSRVAVTSLLYPLAASAVNLTIGATGGTPASPLAYGLIFEDINNSGDGGIYAELIQNRAFQNVTLPPWTGVNGADLTLNNVTGLSAELPNYVTVSGGNGTGDIGLVNPGYYGIDVKPQTYTGQFWARGDYNGNFTVTLLSNLTSEVFTTTTVPGPSTADQWTQYNFTLNPPAAAPNSNNSFSVTFDPSQAPNGSLDFNLLSLFPPTYNNRPNGLRSDIMTILGDQPPSFLRFPGGNNLEGISIPNRFAWNETIGPLEHRRGHTGAWGYTNTDGLGLDEYLDWCIDLDMEPILAIFAGHSLDGTVTPEADFQQWVDDALNELEYILGDTSTQYGALRAQYGHPDPWKVHYVELGNEETLSGGDASYKAYRFPMLYSAISQAYPDLQIIATADDFDLPDGVIYDNHIYSIPDRLVDDFSIYNASNSTNPTLLGETSAIAPNGPPNEPDYNFTTPMQPWATWIGSVAESIYFIGAERFGNGIIGATYAPILQNLNKFEWTPDLVGFAADPAQDLQSTSYYSIQLLSSKRFTQTRPITTEDQPNPAYWVAGDNTDTGAKYLKLAVYNATENVTFSTSFTGLAEGTAANLNVLTAPDSYSENTPGNPNQVITTVTPLTADANGAFSFELPALSVAVLETADKDGKFGVQGGFGGYGGCAGGGMRASYNWTEWVATGNEGNGC